MKHEIRFVQSNYWLEYFYKNTKTRYCWATHYFVITRNRYIFLGYVSNRISLRKWDFIRSEILFSIWSINIIYFGQRFISSNNFFRAAVYIGLHGTNYIFSNTGHIIHNNYVYKRNNNWYLCFVILYHLIKMLNVVDHYSTKT